MSSVGVEDILPARPAPVEVAVTLYWIHDSQKMTNEHGKRLYVVFYGEGAYKVLFQSDERAGRGSMNE